MEAIRIQNRQSRLPVNLKALRNMIEEIFNALNLHNAELSVVLCDDEWIARLNQRYLGRPGPTNVLSFPMTDDNPDTSPPPIASPLGDVVVNVHRACDDAAEAGIDPLSEIAFLIIHGICHLIGYDHEGSNAHRAGEMEDMEHHLHKTFASMLSATENHPETGS